MKKLKLKNLFKIVILFFGILILLHNCQKEDDSSLNSDLQNKNTSISKVSLNDILNQNSLSQKEFGFKSKSNILSKKESNTPALKLVSNKGIKKIDEGGNHYIFLLERTDKIDNYFYNLVIHEQDSILEKFIYKYPWDNSEPIQITKLNDDDKLNEGKTIFNKPPGTVTTDLGANCKKTEFYDVTPCPCVGHTDPRVCECPQQPVWKYLREFVSCFDPDVYDLLNFLDDDDDADPVFDTSNDDFDGTGPVLLSLPTNPDKTPGGLPTNPIPVLTPDFDISNLLGLTNLQRDWLEKIENQWAKIEIENYISQHTGTVDFNNAQIFAQQAIIAWMLNGNTVVDFPNKVILDKTFTDNLKLKCVYDKLTAGNNTLFKNTVGAFIDDPNFNLTFKVGECEKTDDQCTDRTDPYNIVITFEDVNINPIEMAQAILHEAIHAEIARYVKQYESRVDVNNRPRLFELYKYYKELYDEGEIQHIYMTEKYINPISKALREVDDYRYPLDYYKSFAWDGLRFWGANNLLSMEMDSIYYGYRSIVTENTTLCD